MADKKTVSENKSFDESTMNAIENVNNEKIQGAACIHVCFGRNMA